MLCASAAIFACAWLAGCAEGPGPSCWSLSGERLVVPSAQSGTPTQLEPELRNTCGAALSVRQLSLVSLTCEGACPELRLVDSPPLTLALAPGERLPIRIQATAVAGAPGKSTAVLSVSTGPVDAPAVASWDVEAAAVP